MTFNKEFDKFENDRKRENIHLLSLILRNNYTHGDSEVAGVFAGASDRPEVSQEYKGPYLTDPSTFVIRHPDEPGSTNDISLEDSIRTLWERAKDHANKHEYSNPVVTVIHNHSTSNTTTPGYSFTSNDIMLLIESEGVEEIFLDAEEIWAVEKVDVNKGFLYIYQKDLVEEMRKLFNRIRHEHLAAHDENYITIFSEISGNNYEDDETLCKLDECIRMMGYNDLESVLRQFSVKAQEEYDITIQLILKRYNKYCEFMPRP
jgi:hypothetical protein